MNKRNYNRLLVNRNREEGSEKLFLGYTFDKKETLLKTDQTTYFYIPPNTSSILLNESKLIESGAVGGPFPAASDRIFKSRKNYGKHTAYGNPSDVTDGTWFCSWLYNSPDGEKIWMDRYFNPGVFVTTSGLLTSSYIPNDPVFRDQKSTLTLEAEVLYKYFHLGEVTAKNLIKTFAGTNGRKLLFNFSNWKVDENIDTSVNNVTPNIIQNNSSNIFEIFSEEPYVEKHCLKFDGNSTTTVTIPHSSRYIPEQEFTLSFWIQSPSWSNLSNTQLIGNYCSNGGFGLFVQSLSSYPFFVLPETKYGHILFVNEGLNGYLDQSVQEIPKIPAAAAYTTIDFNQHVVVCLEDKSGIIYKLDNAGKIIASSKETEIPFEYVFDNEIPNQILIGINNTVVVKTNRMIYTFDENLNQISQLVLTNTPKDVASFKYNIQDDFHELHIAKNVKDSKFIETTQWLVSADGNLYRYIEGTGSPEMIYEFEEQATKLNIDPYNRIWVMHGNNRISVFDSNAAALESPILQISVGQNINHPLQNLNYFCQYNSLNKQREWLAVVYYSNEQNLHILDMNGKSIKIIDVLSLFNANVVQALDQVPELFEFLGKGDFTGYEHRRVFKNLSPYNNSNQLVLKTALKRVDKTKMYFEHYNKRYPITNWKNKTWQHITITLQKNVFEVFLNGKPILQSSITNKTKLSYELAPLFYFCSSAGSQSGFNKETQYKSESFEGLITNISMYDYKINPNHYELFLRESFKGQDIVWQLPAPNLQYIEKIERVFKQKIPGHKTGFINIKLKGTGIKDLSTKQIIENHIKKITDEVNPAYVDFLKIEWID